MKETKKKTEVKNNNNNEEKKNKVNFWDNVNTFSINISFNYNVSNKTF